MFPSSMYTIMSNQPDHRRLTVWERLPTRQPRTRQRWSTPVQPTASLIQPGYNDLGHRPPRPLRAPAYPLSSRPFLDQQTSSQRNSSQDSPSQQNFQPTSPQEVPTQQTSPRQASPQQTPSQPRTRLRHRVHRISRLFRLSRRADVPAQASPPTSPSPPSIISPPTPSPGADPVALEHPRHAPLPPSPPLPPPPRTSIPLHSSQTFPQPPISPSPPFHTRSPHPPANRRPLSVPPPLRGTDDPREAEQYLHSHPSLQLSHLALCHACSRVRRCMVGLGGGRVLCTECLRQLFAERQE